MRGKFLTTDGTNASWASVDALPSQANNAGKFLTTDGTNASWTNLPPTITNVTPSSFDGNAGQSFSVSGLNFSTGCSAVFIGYDGVTTYSATTTRNSASSLTVVNNVDMPVSNETYTLKVINSDNTYAVYSGIDACSVPSWTTASGSLGSWDESTSVSTSVVATDPDGGSITYSSSEIGTGALSWLSLNSSTGAITGTAPSVSSDTSYSFNVTATDNASNTSTRAFSISVLNYAVPTAVTVLVVGAGGGGARNDGTPNESGGGGGAGGLIYVPSYSITQGQSYTVTIGAGGVGTGGGGSNNGQPNQSSDSRSGQSGNNTIFNDLIAIGGGGGGEDAASQGGCGGGSGRTSSTVALGVQSSQTGLSGTYGYGYNGGRGGSNGSACAGGGGGAGSVGGDSQGGNAGSGGNGRAYSITGTSTYYAGGGGGAQNGSGGPGGGGNGGTTPSSGTANTGGGGGGGGATNLTLTSNPNNVFIFSDTGTDVTIPSADNITAGVMTTTQVDKLDSIASGATANSSDATLLNRTNHTGTQLSSTISDFNAATDARIVAGITGKENTIASGTTALS